MALERRKTLFDTNIPGSVPGAREAARRMSTRRGGQYEGRGGAIVNLSSAAARLGSPNLFVDYATSKGAIDVLTLGLSKELGPRSEEHTSELQSLMRISYAVFCLKKKIPSQLIEYYTNFVLIFHILLPLLLSSP